MFFWKLLLIWIDLFNSYDKFLLNTKKESKIYKIMKKTKKIFLTMGAILPLLISTPLVAAGCVKTKKFEVKPKGETTIENIINKHKEIKDDELNNTKSLLDQFKKSIEERTNQAALNEAKKQLNSTLKHAAKINTKSFNFNQKFNFNKEYVKGLEAIKGDDLNAIKEITFRLNSFINLATSQKHGTTPEKKPEAKPLDNKIIYDNSNDFYKSLDGLSGQNLRDNLFALQKAHRNHSTKYKDLFNTYKDAFVDKYYEKDGSVLDIYEEIPDKEDVFTNWHGKYRDQGKYEGDGMNREHLVPQSWFSKSAPMRTDAHHVWPTDKLVNAWHANYPYGTVKELQGNKISKNGTKTGLSVEDGGPVTEPINEFKGDVARAYLYFCLTYNDLNITSSDQSTRVFKKINEKNTITSIFLKTFLAWNNLDKVSKFDIDRNNGVYKHQGNRNPFIDYPELIDVVYNNNNDYVFKNKGIAIGLNK